MTLLLALDFLKSREFINSSCDFIKSDIYACLHCTVQHLKYSSYLGNYWLLPNLGNDWLLPVSVAIGRTPR